MLIAPLALAGYAKLAVALALRLIEPLAVSVLPLPLRLIVPLAVAVNTSEFVAEPEIEIEPVPAARKTPL
jgi:hypothetical protein